MGSWLGWLILLAGVYFLAVAVRGFIQFVSWFSDEFFSSSQRRRRLEETSERPHTEAAPATMSNPGSHHRVTPYRGSSLQRLLVSAAHITLVHWLATSLEFAWMLVFCRKYDRWVAAVVAEEDLRKKVKYLSRALALNPSYVPAWGLKANALFALQRYDEALQCFEKVLSMTPTATAWCKKGLCCCQLGRYEEALTAFGKALAACPLENGDLRADLLRNKQFAQTKMGQKQPA